MFRGLKSPLGAAAAMQGAPWHSSCSSRLRIKSLPKTDRSTSSLLCTFDRFLINSPTRRYYCRWFFRFLQDFSLFQGVVSVCLPRFSRFQCPTGEFTGRFRGWNLGVEPARRAIHGWAVGGFRRFVVQHFTKTIMNHPWLALVNIPPIKMVMTWR